MKYLARNLYALSIHSPEAAAAVEAATPVEPPPEPDVPAPEPDLSACGAVVLVGFGRGAYLRSLAQRGRRCTPIAVLAPDLGELRWIMENEDWGNWFSDNPHVTVVTDPEDVGAMTRACRKMAMLPILGVSFLSCPGYEDRYSDVADTFHRTCAEAFTALAIDCNTEVTVTEKMTRNSLLNIGTYVSWPGIDELFNCAPRRKAIVCGGGPSLAKGMRFLSVSAPLVTVAVQTALKPMLAEGIVPNFVCALDYSPISRQFYESLTESQVKGCTLVIDANCAPEIPRAWPGGIRCLRSEFLDDVLGPKLAQPRAPLAQGGTVTHMAYYLARYMGCDPVGMLGFDLAFVDGSYYGKGAAIHEQWACELNPFNSLERMEWDRVARIGPGLIRREDANGRRVYTDATFENYRVHAERDFFADKQRGLRTVDLSGGVPKAHTETMTFGEFASC